MKNLIRKILKEESLVKTLLNNIEQDGWKNTAELVGGPENLLSILGESKENVISLLLSYFDDLHIEKRGEIHLMDGGLTLMQTSNWGLGTKVFDSYLRTRLDENVLGLYLEFRRDLIRELISRFPELYSEEITIFKDSGLYQKYDIFNIEE
jgi:hypothetical protein